MKMEISPDRKRILFTFSNMSYGLVVNDAGRLCTAYWGSSLSGVGDVPSDLELSTYPFEEDSNKQWYQQEFSGWGGYFFDEPCIQLAPGYADRALRLSVTEIQPVDSDELWIHLQDSRQPIKITLVYHLCEESGVLLRSARIRNEGEVPLKFSQIFAGAVHLPGQTVYDARYLAGKWAGEHQLRKVRLSQGKFVLESRRGISGPDANPWMVFSADGEARETSGRTYSCAVEWCGNWKLCAETNRYGQLTVLGGWNDYDDTVFLEGGGEIETPRLLLTYSEEGIGGVSRQMHRYIRSSMPASIAATPSPLIYNSWEACFFDFDIKKQMALAEKAADIGAEVFVVDDGWFTNRNDDTSGLGDWTVDPNKFPDGLLPLSRKVQELGMVFGLWAEPEMVSPTSQLVKKHPDWVLAFRADDPPLTRNQLVLNLARDDVKSHVLSVWDTLIEQNEIGYIKWDMNRYLCEPGRQGEAQAESIWRNYGRHLYEILENLTKKHPHLLIENCCSGGGRAEPGMYRYCRIVSRSDNADTLDGLKLFEGYTQVYPPETAIASVSSCPNGINGRSVPLEYRVHMAMMGTMQIGLDLNQLDDDMLEKLREYAVQYKSVRKIVCGGNLYRLASAYERSYSAYQFVSENKENCLVFVFGQSLQFRELQPRLRLCGLIADARYEFEGKTFSGCALMNVGLPLHLNGDFASSLWIIRRKEGAYDTQK